RCFQALRVLRATARPIAAAGLKDQRHIQTPSGHVVIFGSLINDLICCSQKEIAINHLYYGAQTCYSSARGTANRRLFCNWSIQDTIRTKSIKKACSCFIASSGLHTLSQDADSLVP